MRTGGGRNHRSGAMAVLTELRDLWISFANETSFMSDADRAKEIAAIDVLHAATLASPSPSA